MVLSAPEPFVSLGCSNGCGYYTSRERDEGGFLILKVLPIRSPVVMGVQGCGESQTKEPMHGTVWQLILSVRILRA